MGRREAGDWHGTTISSSSGGGSKGELVTSFRMRRSSLRAADGDERLGEKFKLQSAPIRANSIFDSAALNAFTSRGFSDDVTT